MSFEEKMEKELKARTTNAWRAYGSLKNVFKGKMSMSTERKVFERCVKPVLTYGAQTWTLTSRQLKKVYRLHK